MIQYAATYSCSDGPLQAAFEVLNADLMYSYNLLATGLFFVVATFVTNLLIPIYRQRKTLGVVLCCGRNFFSKVNTI